MLDAAYTIAAREGFHSFTLKQVARSADISPAAMIKRFRTKSRLVSLARQHRWESDINALRLNTAPELRGIRGIRHFVSLVATSVASKRLSEHLLAFGIEHASSASRRKVGGYFADVRSMLTKLLQEAVDDRELGAIDPANIAFVLEALIQGSIFQYAFLERHDLKNHLLGHVNAFLEVYSVKVAQNRNETV